jgi:hypothetical protein
MWHVNHHSTGVNYVNLLWERLVLGFDAENKKSL